MEFKINLQETLEARFDDIDEIRDIVNHGIMGGFHGFIYTYELNEFFHEYEDDIEEYYWQIFGDNWISEFSQDITSLDEMRAKMVWGIVEMWCNDKMDEMDDEGLTEE